MVYVCEHTKDSENEVELKMVRFARHVTNEVCGVKCKSAVFYGTELSNPVVIHWGNVQRQHFGGNQSTSSRQQI